MVDAGKSSGERNSVTIMKAAQRHAAPATICWLLAFFMTFKLLLRQLGHFPTTDVTRFSYRDAKGAFWGIPAKMFDRMSNDLGECLESGLGDIAIGDRRFDDQCDFSHCTIPVLA